MENNKINFEIYENANGNSPFEKYLKKLTEVTRAEILATLKRIEVRGLEVAFSAKMAKYIEAGIYEARVKTSDGISREFFFHKSGDNYVLTNGYTKKAQKLNRDELNLAKKYKKDYEARNHG